MTALTAVLFLHVLSAATWLGAALWIPGDVRRSLTLGKDQAQASTRRARPALALDLWSGLATLVTGVAAIWLEGGRPRGGVMVGFAAVALRLGVFALGMRPAYRRVEAAVTAGDLAAGNAPARRVSMFAGIGHLLWVVALAGMVARW